MRMTPFAVATALALIVLASPALADRIDGDWCTDDGTRSLHIDGPAITTPGGHAIKGDYSRHAFSYTVPVGEPGAGSTVDMRLLSETAVEVFSGTDSETWHRCQLNS